MRPDRLPGSAADRRRHRTSRSGSRSRCDGRANRLRIVEARKRDVQVIGLGRLAEDELGAARRAEQTLGLRRGAIDGGLALDPGEGDARPRQPRHDGCAGRTLAHPTMAVVGVVRLGYPVTDGAAQAATFERELHDGSSGMTMTALRQELRARHEWSNSPIRLRRYGASGLTRRRTRPWSHHLVPGSLQAMKALRRAPCLGGRSD